jgi:hypothetical protein
MTKRRVVRYALMAAAAALALTGTAVANAAIEPPEPVFRDLAVSASDLNFNEDFYGTAGITIMKTGQLDNPGDLTIEFQVIAADQVWLDGQECSHFFITGKFSCTIPNSSLPTNPIPRNFELTVQSHKQRFQLLDETYGVEIRPNDADLTNDHAQAPVHR